MSIDPDLLPNFLIIGAPKAGTTTLYLMLKQHPQIFLPFKKELHFFNNDLNFAHGLDWYYKNFFHNSLEFPARGDVTPAYLYWGEKVIPRIKQAYQENPPRMIAILRDPVDRAYSRYWHNRRFNRETLSFEEALEAEERRMERDSDELRRHGKATWAYFKAGLYAEQLEIYFENFPRASFHIILFDDLKADFAGTARKLLGFLNVDPNVPMQKVVGNTSTTLRTPLLGHLFGLRLGVGKAMKRYLPVHQLHFIRSTIRKIFLKEFQYPPINPYTASVLKERFISDIKKLETLIDRDLSKWYMPETYAEISSVRGT